MLMVLVEEDHKVFGNTVALSGKLRLAVPCDLGETVLLPQL